MLQGMQQWTQSTLIAPFWNLYSKNQNDMSTHEEQKPLQSENRDAIDSSWEYDLFFGFEQGLSGVKI